MNNYLFYIYQFFISNMSNDKGDPRRKEEVKISDQEVAGKSCNSEKK